MHSVLLAGPPRLERTAVACVIEHSDDVQLVDEVDLGGPVLVALAEMPSLLVERSRIWW